MEAIIISFFALFVVVVVGVYFYSWYMGKHNPPLQPKRWCSITLFIVGVVIGAAVIALSLILYMDGKSDSVLLTRFLTGVSSLSILASCVALPFGPWSSKELPAWKERLGYVGMIVSIITGALAFVSTFLIQTPV